MFQNLIIRWIVIIGVVCASVYFLLPTFHLYSIKSDLDFQDIDTTYLENDAIKLGLDLQGGLFIVLELDYKKYLLNYINKNLNIDEKVKFSDAINSAIENAKDNNTDILNELSDITKINSIDLRKIYSQFLINKNAKDNNHVISILKDNRKSAMSGIITIMRSRIESHNKYGVGEPSIQQYGNDRMIVELAGVSDVLTAKEYIQRTAEFELTLVEKGDVFKKICSAIDNKSSNTFKLLKNIHPVEEQYRDEYGNIEIVEKFYVHNDDIESVKTILSNSHTLEILHNQYKFLWQDETKVDSRYPNYRQLHLLDFNHAIKNEIQNPKAKVAEIGSTSPPPGEWYVSLDMNREGKIKWSKFTGSNIGRLVAIVLDDKVFMTPRVGVKITTGSTQITGFSGKQEAEDIASVLQAGELPAPIEVKQFNYIGPSLGKDSIDAGSFAMLLGLLLVIIFMIIYYKISGLVAAFALIMNLIFVCAILVSMDAILTLPGLAGLLLTVGMTVDANIIIFERIREELKISNKIRSSILNGYNRAFITILDANITTLITAFVLSFIGSGPIKGFATTLSIGILCSMFTAIFVTKTIFLSMDKYFKITKLKI